MHPLVDTHTHLYLEDYDPDHSEAVERAIAAGVRWMVFPNVNLASVKPMLDLVERYPENTFPAMGLHPSDITPQWSAELDEMERYLDRGDTRYVAIGETGIDLYWDKSTRDDQMEAFDRQLAMAERHRLPVVIHCREGLDETLEVMSGRSVDGAVFHCFGGTDEDVERIRRVGDYYFGIGGVVTFKNSSLRDTLPTIGLDRIVLETDAPWLSPVPMRGKRNESAYMVHTAAYVASQLGLTLDEVAVRTTANARRLFNI